MNSVTVTAQTVANVAQQVANGNTQVLATIIGGFIITVIGGILHHFFPNPPAPPTPPVTPTK